MMDRFYSAVLILLITVPAIQCQAPADANCPSDQTPNILTLMDSTRYNNLIGSGGIWTVFNNDSSGSTTWTVGAGGNCQRTVQVCEAKAQYFKASNWIFTQYIPRQQLNYNITIYVNVTLRITLCSTPNCPRFLPVYNYAANEQQDASVYTNPSKYTLIGNITLSPLQFTQFTATLNFTLKAGDSGFYLGFRDQGSCTSLNRVNVYNYQCPQKQVGLVKQPLTAAPTAQNSPMTISAACVPGSVNTNSLDLFCSNTGIWNGFSTCICKTWEGYRDTGGKCEGCVRGQWLNTLTLTCQPCPANTLATLQITPVCPCRPGYFRAPNELPGDNCTAPPQAPIAVNVSATTGDSITVVWKYVPSLGERLDYYFLLQYKTGDMEQFINAARIAGSIAMEYMYTFHGLSPDTTYQVQLITRNGVSDQDEANEFLRTLSISSKTSIDVPGAVDDITISGRYVIWQPPTHPNGAIKGYNLTIIRDSISTSISVGGTFYRVEDADIPKGNGTVFIQVRAVNGAGAGEWSSKHILPTMTTPGQLVLQSFDSCVMWSVPEETVLQYEIHYNNITKVQNYTTNWYCLQDEIHNAVNITVRAVNGAGAGEWSSNITILQRSKC